MVLKTVLGLLWLQTAQAAVNVRQTGAPPTGYEVDITYNNTTATSVLLGGIDKLTDEFHTSGTFFSVSGQYDFASYKPGDFRAPTGNPPGTNAIPMTKDANGVWTVTLPLPSGQYPYTFHPDCPGPGILNCSTFGVSLFPDPDNPPFVNLPGDQLTSQFQVPFDEQFQAYPISGLNFDYALPVSDASQRGEIRIVNYTSPGSTHPATDVHDYTIYLPAGYQNNNQTIYPLLYLSHGGGGNAFDWPNQGHVANILDRLIAQRSIEPTIVVMPSFEFLISTNDRPSAADVLANYRQFLFPLIDASWPVSMDVSKRAFAGLSLGGILTTFVYQNATDLFSYFGIFSGATGPNNTLGTLPTSEDVAANPRLAEVGVFNCFGQYDIAADDMRAFESRLDGIGIKHVTRFQPAGFHTWTTWQDCLWNFGLRGLWQTPVPFSAATGRNVSVVVVP